MTSWLRWACGRAADFRRRRSAPARRRPPRAGRLATVEGLERREVLSGAVPFVITPGVFPAPAAPDQVAVTLQPNQILSIHGKPVILAFDVQPAAGSNVAPQISGVLDPAGNPKASLAGAGGEVFITSVRPSNTTPINLTVEALSANNQAGSFVVRSFLAGDLYGNGAVDALDIATIRAAMGSSAGQARYNPAADLTHSGSVTAIDLRIARMNFGAHATASAPTPRPAATPAPAPVVVPAPVPRIVAVPPPTLVVTQPQPVAVQPALVAVPATPAAAVPVQPTVLVPATLQTTTAVAATPTTTVAPNAPIYLTPAATPWAQAPAAYSQGQPATVAGQTTGLVYMLTPVSAPTSSTYSTPITLTPASAQPAGPATYYTLSNARQ